MGDSRRRDDLTGEDRGGGRGPGARRRAGVAASRRVRAGIYLIAVLAGLAPAADRGVRAQQAEAPQPAGAAPPDVQDLSLRYRFIERYGLTEDLGRPDQLVQYQVGTFETIKHEIEQPRGAPARQEITYQTVYTERPAKLGRLGEVTDTVRRYDLFRPVATGPASPRAAMMLKDLMLWFHPRSAGAPEMIALTPNRTIRQIEYAMILDQIFTPRLVAVLPSRPVLLKDRWPISRQAARVILSRVPDDGELRLEATLSSVDKAADGTAMTAIIDIEGVLDFEEGAEGAVRARLWFVFEPLRVGAGAAEPSGAATPSPKRAAARDAGLIEARGHVSKLVMSVRKSSPIDKDGRLQHIQTGELHLERRPAPAQVEPLAVPKEPPAPDETNSWIVYDDPQGRFHFRHPQGFGLQLPGMAPDEIIMAQPLRNGNSDVFHLTVVPKEQWKSDPQAFVRDMKQASAEKGLELVQGPAGWLPEQEWAPLKRRVYRVQTAIKPDDRGEAPRGAPRGYLDAYQIQFTRGDTFHLRAMTDREDHSVVRDQAEKLIRTLDLGPSAPGMAGPPAQNPEAPPDDAAPPRDLPAAPPVPRPDRRP